MKIDYTKPLVWQILTNDYEYEDYIKFIHEPKHIVNPVRDIILFENPILETMTKTPWYMIPAAFSILLYYYYVNS